MNSKIEELFKRLLNCESIEDFVPQSRSEAYLKAAILRSGTENLPYPASRLDALLYDLTDKISNSLHGYKTQEKIVILSQIEQEIVPDEGYVLSKVKVNNELLKGLIERNITDLEIPNGVTSIGDYAFNSYSSLTSVVIGDGVTSIGKNAFGYCSHLMSVTIPNSVTKIGERAFYDCDSLTSVIIPDSVTKIDMYTFGVCDSLTSVTIPNSVTSIANYAFYGCNSLTSITIPNSVKSIGHQALYYGSTTNKVTFVFNSTTPPTIQSSTFNASYISKIIVPAGCSSAYKSATNWSSFADYIEEATV